MDNFKIATQQKLRVKTLKGELSTEQLWELSLEELDGLAVNLEEEFKKSGKESFLVDKSEKDKTAKLKFDVVLEVLNTKNDEATALTEAREIKKHNQKIDELIAAKEDEKLSSLSISQLQRMKK
jgi:hypothetical protein